jgi:iron complex transport system substrate-binding protein
VDLRIVSCNASATEIIHSLELGQFQVGRSHECDWPVKVSSLPVCTRPRFDIHGDSAQIDQRVKDTLRDAGSVYEVLTGVLEPLKPTHILTQTQCKVCAVSLADVEAAFSKTFQSNPQVVALEPNSLADIYRDIRKVATACGVTERAEILIQKINAEFDEILSLAKMSSRPTVACIEWTEPLMAAGNWIPELVEIANGQAMFGTAGSYSPYIQFEQLQRADPEVIVIMPCGYDLAKTKTESHWLTSKAGWTNLQAVRNQRVYYCNANRYMTRPGPRIVESTRALAEMLHPRAFSPSLRGIAWDQ